MIQLAFIFSYFLLWGFLLVYIVLDFNFLKNKNHFKSTITNINLSNEIIWYINDKTNYEYKLNTLNFLCIENTYPPLENQNSFSEVILIQFTKNSSMFKNIETVLLVLGRVIFYQQSNVQSAKMDSVNKINFIENQNNYARNFANNHMFGCLQYLRSKEYIQSNFLS